MNPQLKEKINESLAAVLPITGIVLALSIFLIPLDVGTMVMFIFGAVLLIFGMGMFQLGAEMSMEPLGEGIGAALSKTKFKWIVTFIAFAMGMIITLAEPDLQVLAELVPSVPNMAIIYTVAIGVGIFLAVAVLRIMFGIDLSILLVGLYVVLLGMSFFVPREFLAVAFDSGGVTTGPITVPFIMALGVGISSVRGDKNASSDSFGLVALSSVGPIIAVMVLGCFYHPESSEYMADAIIHVETMIDVSHAFADRIPQFAEEVIVSIIPIVAVFIAFQFISRRYTRRQRFRVAMGFVYTYLGLVLFLCGVNVGFAPVGTMIGKELAATDQKWLLVPIGMLIGYFVVKAEPAIQILNHQVQSVTSGAVSANTMNICLSVGVAISLGLSMLRILCGIPIFYIVLPGYIIALVMSRLVPKMFVGIAFDSGGVASGPMTSTFLLPLCIGACQMLGGNIMTDAFGAVALVALTPLISVQIMGLTYRYKMYKKSRMATMARLPLDSDEIIEIAEV